MLKRFLMRSVVLSLVGISSSAYGMLKKPQDFGECKKPTSQTSLALQNVRQGEKIQGRSFNDLPQCLQIQITDYLDPNDQFSLAQTSRQQLFLWASLSRVPDPVEVTTSTQDITHFNWDDAQWPTTVGQTVVIHLSRSIEEVELLNLYHFQKILIDL